ncbi:Rrf2 family transcriptional regulator [Pseudoroseomonas cervicalis]|uniref:RrF2 family transcriptional regulator n=1 Tax=Teichococcus cervicalis TaxID=204525 RepID=UPI0027825D6E|nr:Rrf2 family transcriptional regulator [Pseudoroseomonas cervicalis]MDQ1079503.1 Rrf2 family iron-sulfur cluster assembly transcriptional regulator [Pseudoroseomonas cervicalis]
MLLRRDRVMTAVSIVLDVAFHAGRGTTVPAGDIAERLGEARRGIEPVLQALSRAGILGSTRGPKGGYRLGRAARDITLAELVAAVAGPDLPREGEEAESATPSPLQEKVLRPLWQELEEAMLARLGELTVAELLRRAALAGLRRPTPEALNFAI